MQDFRILSFAAAAQVASATAQNLKRVMHAYAQQTTRPLSTMELVFKLWNKTPPPNSQ